MNDDGAADGLDDLAAAVGEARIVAMRWRRVRGRHYPGIGAGALALSIIGAVISVIGMLTIGLFVTLTLADTADQPWMERVLTIGLGLLPGTWLLIVGVLVTTAAQVVQAIRDVAEHVTSFQPPT